MNRIGVLMLAAGLSLAPALAALGLSDDADPRIHEDGRRAAVWPASPLFDYQHMKLVLDIPDMSQPKLRGQETLRLAALGRARDAIRLDCNGPEIKEVRLGRDALPFTVADKVLLIQLPRPAAVGTPFEIQITYDLDFGKNKGNGLTYSTPHKKPPNDSFAFPQIHSQGEAQENSRWFPCHDFPNDRLTTELIVTVETGYEVSSNGNLLSKKETQDGRTTWHWLQNKPHVNYLVTLVVGKFGVVELGGPDSARPGLPMPVYTFLGTEDAVRKSFADTPEMVAFFEEKFDEPYPWDKYAQVIVRDFRWGGMENTSATTLYAQAANGDDETDLISHELAHQWFGDLITCRTWEHLWLNEGWASISEALWQEHKGGPENGRKEYLKVIRRFAGEQRAGNRGKSPDAPALASNRYADPDEAIMKADDVYAKGAMVLHMLRQRLGDAVFTAGTRLYLDRYKYNQAETDDFRRCMEEVSGQSLERFFDQWVNRPGLPRLDIDLEWDDSSKQLAVTIEQTQTINADNPAYAFSFPLYAKYEDGGGEYLYVKVDGRQARATFTLPSKPSNIATDPSVSVLAGAKVRKPLVMWIDQLRSGPTIISQLDAAEELASSLDPSSAMALLAVAQDPASDALLRTTASQSVAIMWLRDHAQPALTALVRAPRSLASRSALDAPDLEPALHPRLGGETR